MGLWGRSFILKQPIPRSKHALSVDVYGQEGGPGAWVLMDQEAR